MKSSSLSMFLSKALAVTFISVILFGSAFADSNIVDRCRLIGGQSEPLCDVSIYAVISGPSRFDGAEISVVGFYSEGIIPILFANKTAYEVSDVSSGIFLDLSETDATTLDLIRRNNRRALVVIGSYSKAGKPTYEVRGFATSGTIKVTRAGIAPGPWGIAEPPVSSTEASRAR